jgi:hypothetical protein
MTYYSNLTVFFYPGIPLSGDTGQPNHRWGASQSDIAFLEAESIHWENHVIRFARKTTGPIALLWFDESAS